MRYKKSRILDLHLTCLPILLSQILLYYICEEKGDMMKKVVLFIVLVLAGSCVFASDAVQKFVLENGQNVIIKEVHSNPIVTMDTWIKTGSINENDDNNGVSHFLEHLFFKGSKNHPTGEFDKLLETRGGVTNAATSKDYTHYYITIPSKFFDEALSLHADMLLNPLVPRKELEKERKVVLEEIAKDENSPNNVVYDNLVSMLYTNHPYKRKVIGKRSIIETIHRDEIMDYYGKWYIPGNMVTVIVGDVDAGSALEKVKENFGTDIQKAEKTVFKKEKPLTEQKRKVEYLDTQSAYMLIGFRGVAINNSDSYALDVLATILGEGRTSVFYKNIKDKMQLATSISASNVGFRDDGIFYISANFIPEKLTKLENQIFCEIDSIIRNGVTSEQVSLAKNIIERDTYYQRESISNIAQEIGYVMVTSGDIKVYDNYVDNIKKVTPHEVKRVAEKYLGKSRSAVSIVLPESSKEVKTSAVSSDIKGSAVLNSESNGIQSYKLSNGATLIFTQNTSNEIVAISIFAKGGNFTDAKYGTAALTSEVMMKGTKNYSSHELAEVLEDNGIKISPSTRSDAFLISVLTTVPQYDTTLNLLNEVVNNATFSNYEIDKVKTDKLNSIKRSRDIPLNVALEGYKNLIFSGTPYTNSIALMEKNIPQITRNDIVNYYNKIFAPQNIVISINGNVDKEKTIQIFSNMFKSSDNSKFRYSGHKSELKDISTPKTVVKQIPTTNTDWIILGWPVAGLDEKKDFAALSVIDSLLGTGMSSRLFVNLRDQEGLAYQLGSSYSANALKGSFIVYIGTNPETYDKSLAGLWKEINRLKTEFVGSKELQEAKDKLTGQFVLSLETNMDKASANGWYETSMNDYNFTNEFEKLINSVTETDIMHVANKYFKENNYVMSAVKK